MTLSETKVLKMISQAAAEDDEWETDPEPAVHQLKNSLSSFSLSFFLQNLVSPIEQRWGAKHLPNDRKEFKDMRDLREQVSTSCFFRRKSLL
jgi:hypothetical protein